MIKVPDAASFAAMSVLSGLIGRKVGGSTGTNLMGVLQIASEMHASGKHGSIVTLICDSGQRYEQSYFSDDWLKRNGFDVAPWEQKIRAFMLEGIWDKALQQPSHARSDIDLREGI